VGKKIIRDPESVDFALKKYRLRMACAERARFSDMRSFEVVIW
jgi:hypothetical protein